MEEKQKNLTSTDNSSINTQQGQINPQGMFNDNFSRPNEPNKNGDHISTNKVVMPKIPTVIELQIENILAHKLNRSVGQIQFLVKYKERSYHDLRWIYSLDFGKQAQMVNDYLKDNPVESEEPFFNPRYLIPDKIVSVKKVKLQKHYLVKWHDLDYTHATWEKDDRLMWINAKYGTNPNLIQEYEKSIESTPKGVLSLSASPNFHPMLEFHLSKNGNKLNSLQIDILNFLLNTWCFSQNVLISDIEGIDIRLGVVTFLERIINQTKGNFLIIADQPSIEKWMADINEWTDLRYLPFIGNKENLEIMKKYEFSKPGSTSDDFIYSLYITTLENFMSYHRVFSLTSWDGTILDNITPEKVIFEKSALNFIASKIKMRYRAFLTPPLDGVDPHKIWPWLNFIDLNNFHIESRFTKHFCKDGKVELKKLNHNNFSLFENSNNIKFNLREIFVKCPLTQIQEDSFKSIYSPLLNTSSNQNFAKNGYNLKQIGSSIRKLLVHPFCIKDIANKVKQEKKKSIPANNYSISDTDFFVKTCGKLFVLDLLLKKLKAESKNVVIICQTSDAIEILEKYMLNKAFSYEKVDLYTRGRSRFDAVNQFNDESRRIFAFILDTKTGYFSMKANYVIIYESDWNPYNDIFVANKILSSENKKEVYRLVTEKTYECAFMNENVKLSDINAENSVNIEFEIIGKLVDFGLNELQSEESINENNDLKDFINSDQPDVDSLLEKHTFIKNYNSIEDLSDHITIERWKKLFQKIPEKKEYIVSEKNINEKQNKLSPSKEMILSKKNEDIENELEEESSIENELYTEEEEFNENDFTEDEMKADQKGWTPKLIIHLFNLMLKYGITSWDSFTRSIPQQVSDIMKVGLIIIQNLLSHSNRQSDNIILQKYLDSCISKEQKTKFLYKNETQKAKSPSKNITTGILLFGLDINELFDNDFTKIHSKTLKKISTSRVEWKLSILEFLYIVDISYKARQKSKGHPTIPSFRQSTLENDSKIMETVKKKGFPLTKYTDSLKSTKMALKKINDRARSLVDEAKNLFINYCQIFELDEELTPEKLIDSLKFLNTKEKKKVFQAIQTCGIDDLKATFEASKLKRDKYHFFLRYIDQFKKFAHTVIRQKKVPFDFFGIHYSLKVLTEFIFTVAILTYLREMENSIKFDSKDTLIFDYLRANGFKNLKKQEIFTSRFKDPIDQELNLYLHNYFSDKKRIIYRNFFKDNDFEFTTSPTKPDPPAKPVPVSNDKDTENFQDDEQRSIKLANLLDTEYSRTEPFTDEEIASILPIKINDSTIIRNLGKVVTDRPGFHCERYLYLDGFTSERYFTSISDPNEKEWYVFKIIDNGGDLPVFRIESKNDPSVFFEGNVPSRPSIELLRAISNQRKGSKNQAKSPTISGPEFFALASPKVRKLMDHLPGAEKCQKFRGTTMARNVFNFQAEEPRRRGQGSEAATRKRRSWRKKEDLFVDDDEYDDDENYNNDDESEEEDVDGYDEDDEDEDDEDIDDGEEEEEEEDIVDDDDDDEYGENNDLDDDDEDDDIIVMKTRRRKRIGENNSDDDEDYRARRGAYSNANSDDRKSLFQRVKTRYSEKNQNKPLKKFNLRKRNNKKNLNEYDDEEEDDYDNDNTDTYSQNYDDDDDSHRSKKNDNELKSSPNKNKKKNKDKKKMDDDSHLSDSSDEENYYDFACNNIPDMLLHSDEKLNLGNKSGNKKNALNSGVIFYFDKLTGKPEKDYIINYFHGDSNMLYIDQNFLEEFLSQNPKYAQYFNNK